VEADLAQNAGEWSAGALILRVASRYMTVGQEAEITREVDRAFRSLPDRYLGAPPGFDASWHIRLGDIGRSWEVHCTTHGARVRAGRASRKPDVTIGTDAQTWLELREGHLSGIEAFSQRRLYVRGDLDLAVGFEGMFRLAGGRPPLLRIHDVPVGRLRISTLTMGEGPDIILLHGLGATKASLFDAAAALAAEGYRVHALDLPGFGGSSKRPSQYGARYFARVVVGLMDAIGIDRAHFVGNSMGGRVAIEVGLSHPERVGALALLCPAVAFVRRDFALLVRLLRPELGMLPHSFGRTVVEKQFWSMFADRDQVDPVLADIVVDEFERIYRSPGARLAFLSSARAIYLEKPFGAAGFYPRLGELQAPAMFVWGTGDKLVPSAFSRHVEQWLPTAEQVVLEGCGHVPQVERPEQTNGLLRRFFAHADAMGRLRAVA
jgi:pimeloyl-ACP methyl ester carboxylesterase/predicted lipid carrier protein YhbT